MADPEVAAGLRGLERIETARLVLRKPCAGDADAVFGRYAGDPEVTRYLGWPRHRSVDETRAFLAFSDAEWQRWPVGPFYALCHPDHRASWRVLEKCGFLLEGLLRRHSEFPNLGPDEPADTLCYVRVFE